MKVNKDVEPAVREAFGAAVAGDGEWFTTALEQLVARGEPHAQEALRLAFAIDAAALYRVQERRPTDDELATLANAADQFSAEWSDSEPLGTDALRTFLTALADGAPVTPSLTTEDTVLAAFVAGSYLLADFLPDGMEWTDLLDQILDALEAAPEPSA